jgi:hypothetical protein
MTIHQSLTKANKRQPQFREDKIVDLCERDITPVADQRQSQSSLVFPAHLTWESPKVPLYGFLLGVNKLITYKPLSSRQRVTCSAVSFIHRSTRLASDVAVDGGATLALRRRVDFWRFTHHTSIVPLWQLAAGCGISKSVTKRQATDWWIFNWSASHLLNKVRRWCQHRQINGLALALLFSVSFESLFIACVERGLLKLYSTLLGYALTHCCSFPAPSTQHPAPSTLGWASREAVPFGAPLDNGGTNHDLGPLYLNN